MKQVTKSFTIGSVTFSEVKGDEGGMTISAAGGVHVSLSAEEVSVLRRDLLYQLDTEAKKVEIPPATPEPDVAAVKEPDPPMKSDDDVPF